MAINLKWCIVGIIGFQIVNAIVLYYGDIDLIFEVHIQKGLINRLDANTILRSLGIQKILGMDLKVDKNIKDNEVLIETYSPMNQIFPTASCKITGLGS